MLFLFSCFRLIRILLSGARCEKTRILFDLNIFYDAILDKSPQCIRLWYSSMIREGRKTEILPTLKSPQMPIWQ